MAVLSLFSYSNRVSRPSCAYLRPLISFSIALCFSINSSLLNCELRISLAIRVRKSFLSRSQLRSFSFSSSARLEKMRPSAFNWTLKSWIAAYCSRISLSFSSSWSWKRRFKLSSLFFLLIAPLSYPLEAPLA